MGLEGPVTADKLRSDAGMVGIGTTHEGRRSSVQGKK